MPCHVLSDEYDMSMVLVHSHAFGRIGGIPSAALGRHRNDVDSTPISIIRCLTCRFRHVAQNEQRERIVCELEILRLRLASASSALISLKEDQK